MATNVSGCLLFAGDHQIDYPWAPTLVLNFPHSRKFQLKLFFPGRQRNKMEKQYFDAEERIISIPAGKRKFDAALFGETIQQGFTKVSAQS